MPFTRPAGRFFHYIYSRYETSISRKTEIRSLCTATRRTVGVVARPRGRRPQARARLRRGVRGRRVLARHIRPFPQPLSAFRDLGAQPRGSAHRQERAYVDDTQFQRGAAAVRRLRFRLPLGRSHAAIGRDKFGSVHVPHLYLCHRELSVLRPLAAQRVREGDQKRLPHLRLRDIHGRVLAHHLSAVSVVRLFGGGVERIGLHAGRFQELGASGIPRNGQQRRGNPRVAGAQRAPPPQPTGGRASATCPPSPRGCAPKASRPRRHICTCTAIR